MKTAEEWADVWWKENATQEGCPVSPEFIKTIQAESRLAALEEAAFLCKLDVESLERDANDLKGKKDELNAYLYNAQAMAHRLDVERIGKVIKHLQK